MSIYLGIESSCDDSAVAIYDQKQGLIAHQCFDQSSIHQEFGGVVPELAARDHIRVISTLVERLFDQTDFHLRDVKGIGYTAGPGLVGSLLVGAMMGKTLSWALGCPSLGIHHLEGHILSPFLTEKDLTFPFLSLVVSGGHTLLVDVKSAGCYQMIGQSVDDAAGEVFDKVAKLFGLSYPGGAHIEQLSRLGNQKRFGLPRPMIQQKDTFNFSFSGLKTAVLRNFQAMGDQVSRQDLCDLSASFEQAVIDCLFSRVKQALEVFPRNRIVICGGVSANQALRSAFSAFDQMGIRCFWPSLQFCSDNAAMIALPSTYRLLSGFCDDNLAPLLKARWNIEDLKGFCFS